MRHILEAGTDGACITIFDPGALPADFDARLEEDPRQAADDAQDRGQCFISDTGGDGGHVLHVYLDEAVPAQFLPRSRHIGGSEAFLVPSGRLYFTGAEYLCRDELLEPGPEVSGQCVELPRGSYAARFYILESSEGVPGVLHELEAPERRALRALPVLVISTLAALVAAGVLLSKGGATPAFFIALAVLAAAGFGAWRLQRSSLYGVAYARRDALRRERFPDFILALTSPG